MLLANKHNYNHGGPKTTSLLSLEPIYEDNIRLYTTEHRSTLMLSKIAGLSLADVRKLNKQNIVAVYATLSVSKFNACLVSEETDLNFRLFQTESNRMDLNGESNSARLQSTECDKNEPALTDDYDEQ